MMSQPSTFSTDRNSLKLLPLFATVALFGLTASLHAASIVTDDGFESAGGGNEYFAGHSIDGGSWNVVTGAVYIDSGDPYVYAGSNSLNLTGVNPYTADAVSQTLTTIAGDVYTLNFWANSDSPNTFSLLANGVAIAGAPTSILNDGFPGAITNSSLFTDYSETFRASTNSTTLTFSDVSNPSLTNPNQSGSVLIDNVSVQIAPTPEPGSAVLMSTGLLALALVAGRKRLLQSSLTD
jgi:hypothetical protein